jgi:curved DNA-binding protein CbpA
MSQEGWKQNRPPRNHYELLGIKRDATPDEIKDAFRSLSKKYHPDTGGDAEKFKRLSGAYEDLRKPNKRQEYDRKISNNPTFSDEDYGNEEASSAEGTAESFHTESPEADPVEPETGAEERTEEARRAIWENLERRGAGAEDAPEPQETAAEPAPESKKKKRSPFKEGMYRVAGGTASRFAFFFAVVFSIIGHVWKESKKLSGGGGGGHAPAHEKKGGGGGHH